MQQIPEMAEDFGDQSSELATGHLSYCRTTPLLEVNTDEPPVSLPEQVQCTIEDECTNATDELVPGLTTGSNLNYIDLEDIDCLYLMPIGFETTNDLADQEYSELVVTDLTSSMNYTFQDLEDYLYSYVMPVEVMGDLAEEYSELVISASSTAT